MNEPRPIKFDMDFFARAAGMRDLGDEPEDLESRNPDPTEPNKRGDTQTNEDE
jgi:hypothetical protein